MRLVVALVLWGSLLLPLACGPNAAPLAGKDAESPDAAVDVALTPDAVATDTNVCSGSRHLRIDLGEVLTTQDGRTPALTFDVPPCARSFVITVHAAGAQHLTLAELSPPSGPALVPKAWLDLASSPMACVGACANRIVAQPGVAAFLFPNTPLVELRPGEHRVRAYAFERKGALEGDVPVKTALQLRVDLVLQTATEPQTLRLPVRLGLTGARDIHAGIAADHPRVKLALATLAQRLAPAGIVADPVTFHDVGDTHQVVRGIHGPDSDLARLFRAGADLPVGLPVFLVERIEVDAGRPPGSANLLGISGGIPGPPREVGCDRCGVALSLAPVSGHPDLLGPLMAHEISHFLGLFHTTEPPPDGGGAPVRDNLPDTPHDATANLLYWAVTEGSVQLSAQQRQVLRASPWLEAAD